MRSTAVSWARRAARHVLALAGAGLALTSASASAAVPTVRVMPLGDSITWGVGSATTSSYRRPLANLLANQSRYAVSFVGSQASGNLPDLSNEGHSGYTIDQIRAGIDDWMAGARPDVVLLHIGINDLNRGIDVPNAPNRLKALVDRIFADKHGVTVLVLGLIPTTPAWRHRSARSTARRGPWKAVSSRRATSSAMSNRPRSPPPSFPTNSTPTTRATSAWPRPSTGRWTGRSPMAGPWAHPR
ncbi:SGNH/GDSL hydrolase family protein [Cystobacter fuscus]